MKRSCVAAIFAFFLLCASSARGAEKYAWAGPDMDFAVWGMARGDIDGDGTVETVLLERDRIRVGAVGAAGFEEAFDCRWETAARAARLYLYDVNGDGRLEAVISAVEEGLPSSLVLDVDMGAGRCAALVSRARLSLRAIDSFDEAGVPQRKLVGQGWSQADFFSGAVRELKLSRGRLKAGKAVPMPRNTGIFQFAILPPRDGAARAAILRGPSHMELHEASQRGRWRRVWRSGERLGGSANWLSAEQRPVLDQLASAVALFDLAPVALGESILAVRADMPTRDIIGPGPYVRGGEIILFSQDPALGYVEGLRTQRLPGAVVDFDASSRGPDGGAALTVLIQPDTSAFGKPTSSKLISFDLSSGKR